jgi:hypothetical protein
MSIHTGVLPSVVSPSQGNAAFEPPPGIVEESLFGPINTYHPESGSPVYEAPSPRRAFDNQPILDNGIVPDVSLSPVREHFSSITRPIHSPAREHFEIISGNNRSPAQEHYTVVHSPRGNASPAQEYFTNAHSHRDFPSPTQEYFTTTHPPRAAATRIDDAQLMDGRQNPEFSERPSSRSVRCFLFLTMVCHLLTEHLARTAAATRWSTKAISYSPDASSSCAPI